MPDATHATPITYLDTKAIAAMFGVTRATVTNKWSKAPGFPAPAQEISRRSRWWRADQIEAWAAGGAARNRSPRPTVNELHRV